MNTISFKFAMCLSIGVTLFASQSALGIRMLKSGTVAPGITPSGGSYLQFGEQVAGDDFVCGP